MQMNMEGLNNNWKTEIDTDDLMPSPPSPLELFSDKTNVRGQAGGGGGLERHFEHQKTSATKMGGT